MLMLFGVLVRVNLWAFSCIDVRYRVRPILKSNVQRVFDDLVENHDEVW